MTSKTKLAIAKKWIIDNSNQILNGNEQMLEVGILSTELRADPTAKNLGLSLGSRHEVKPQLFFVSKDSKGNMHIGIAEVSEKPLNLTSLGVMQVYARMVEPRYAIILCEKSMSKELLELRANPSISKRLFNYSNYGEIQLYDVIF